mmetsp:Transcript_9884/g.20092  ORF Transcript_9884/g.20092 Transcript_9884/m.20092 type:complete len:317 (+) Transcript_9884:1946-2896(+)
MYTEQGSGNNARVALYRRISFFEHYNEMDLASHIRRWAARVGKDFEWDSAFQRVAPRTYEPEDAGPEGDNGALYCPPVRLVLLPVQGSLADDLAMIGMQLVQILGPRLVFCYEASTLHISLFHFSRSFERQPLLWTSLKDEQRVADQAWAWIEERGGFHLELDQILLDQSGNLLATFMDLDGADGIDHIRTRLSSMMDSAVPKHQTRVIIHVTICRIVAGASLRPEHSTMIRELVREASTRLAGRQYHAKAMWHSLTCWRWTVEGYRSIYGCGSFSGFEEFRMPGRDIPRNLTMPHSYVDQPRKVNVPTCSSRGDG